MSPLPTLCLAMAATGPFHFERHEIDTYPGGYQVAGPKKSCVPFSGPVRSTERPDSLLGRSQAPLPETRIA